MPLQKVSFLLFLFAAGQAKKMKGKNYLIKVAEVLEATACKGHFESLNDLVAFNTSYCLNLHTPFRKAEDLYAHQDAGGHIGIYQDFLTYSSKDVQIGRLKNLNGFLPLVEMTVWCEGIRCTCRNVLEVDSSFFPVIPHLMRNPPYFLRE